jgi:hypothetical protein
MQLGRSTNIPQEWPWNPTGLIITVTDFDLWSTSRLTHFERVRNSNAKTATGEKATDRQYERVLWK